MNVKKGMQFYMDNNNKNKITRENLTEENIPENKPSSKKKRLNAALVLTIVSVLFCIFTVVGFILMRKYFSDAEYIRKIIGNNYALGAFVMVIVTAIQVVVAFIPGELVEIAAGYIFGTYMGTALVLTGAVLGSICAILLTRKFGIKLFRVFYPDEDINSLPLLRDKKERNILTFLLFLIPGTPKDMLTYVIGLTDMKIWMYLLLTTFARIPSIISSAAGGNAVGESKILTAVYIFAAIAVVSIIGLIIYKNIKNKKKN